MSSLHCLGRLRQCCNQLAANLHIQHCTDSELCSTHCLQHLNIFSIQLRHRTTFKARLALLPATLRTQMCAAAGTVLCAINSYGEHQYSQNHALQRSLCNCYALCCDSSSTALSSGRHTACCVSQTAENDLQQPIVEQFLRTGLCKCAQ